MRTVNDFLDQVKLNSGIESDYRLAKTLNLTINTISNYRHGRSRPDDLVLSKLAELGNIPTDQVELLAVALQAERASSDEARALWHRIAARLQGGAVHGVVLASLVAAGFITTPPNAHATVTEAAPSDRLYIMSSLLIRVFRAVIGFRRKFPFGKLAGQQHQGIAHVSSSGPAAATFALA